jgi:hypothetical protein
MRVEPLLTLTCMLVLLTACATDSPSKRKGAMTSDVGGGGEARPITNQQPACIEPSYLVRDLTVPWAQREYLIGPCDGGSNQGVNTRTHHEVTPMPTSVETLGTGGGDRP